jgi:imidazole glycerol phosphate synthase glutamine amidotransferase subunit
VHVQILHLGYGNSKSLEYVLNRISNDIFIERLDGKCEEKKRSLPEILFLPGVGNFGLAMEQIRAGNWDAHVERLAQEKVKIVGICLGMQLLGYDSEESASFKGLGLIPGRVKKLNKLNSRVPNVGWRPIEMTSISPHHWSEFNARSFYFTHSYYFHHTEEDNVVATVEHGSHKFASIVKNESTYGFQFHLEKSGSDGLEFLRKVIYENDL